MCSNHNILTNLKGYTMKTILVLGSTGTVGAHLTQQLVDAGYDVKAATRSPERYAGAGTATSLDVTNPETFSAALDGVDRVFVLSPPGHTNQHDLLEPFLKVAFTKPQIDRIVTMTAQGIDAFPELPFRQLELLIEGSGKHFVHLRPTWFNQNFHTFWGEGVREHDTIALPAADAKVAFIDTRDISSSAFGALTRDDIELDKGWELTGPVAMTHAEAAVILSEHTGKTITYQSITDDDFRGVLGGAGMPDDYTEMLIGLFEGLRAGASERVTDAVETLSGKAPLTLDVYAKDYRDALGKL